MNLLLKKILGKNLKSYNYVKDLKSTLTKIQIILKNFFFWEGGINF